MSLRARLVVTVVALAAVAMLLVVGAVAGALQDWRSDRYQKVLSTVGRQLQASLAERQADERRLSVPASDDDLSRAWRTTADDGELPSFFQVRTRDGRVVQTVGYGDRPALGGTLPDRLRPVAPTAENRDGEVFGDVDGWLLRASSAGADHVLVVGMRAPAGDALFGRVTAVVTTCSVVALMLVALLGWWLVRRAFLPLDRMAATADAIGASDLGKRVEPAGGSTEVGRLGAALNAMLGQIQAGVEARERSEQRLREFVADASHELRTPTATIRGYAELFRRGAAERPDDLAKAMRRIEAEASRMGDLVDELLLLARLDQGRPLDVRPVDLSQLAADAVADAGAAAPGRTLTLVADGEVTVQGDAARLGQALGNLLANVAQHTAAGVAATVRVSRADGHGVVEVADEGQGLSADERARVFERFYRAPEARAGARGGAGLGLSIVAAIAGAHGGTVEVSSAPGEGTVFLFRIPE